MIKESLLAHLAPLLTNQIENVATDALAHLLLQYEFIPSAFLEYLSPIGVDLPYDLTFKTQARSQDTAIPDLVGLDELGHYLLIIESKFWASLTPNQPNTYIKRLPFDKSAILLFIAPASRMSYLWQTLLNRCNLSHGINHFQQQIPPERILSYQLNDKHILALISWESLLSALYTKAQQAEDEYAKGDIWQLRSLCAKVDVEAFHPLSEDEITSPTKKRIEQFRGLIDELVSRLVDSGFVSIGGFRATPGPNYYKRYMSINDVPNWCIEFNEEFRRQYPPTNLWLSLWVKPNHLNLISRLSSVGLRQGKRFLIPLKIPTAVEREEILTSLTKQIIDISNLF